MAQPNQFTKADAEGRPRPQSSNAYMKGTRTKMDPRQKAAIQATQLMNRLHKYALARGEKAEILAMKAEQVSAAKAVIDKGMPSLQAIEHSEADPLDALSEQEMQDMIKSHILAHPEVIQALNLIPNPAVVHNQGVQPGDTLVTTITKIQDSSTPTGT